MVNGELLARALYQEGWRVRDDGTVLDEEGEALGPLTMELAVDVHGFMLELPEKLLPGLPRARA